MAYSNEGQQPADEEPEVLVYQPARPLITVAGERKSGGEFREYQGHQHLPS